MNNDENTTKTYYVSFIYSVGVEADEPSEAEDKAYEVFAKSLSDGLTTGDFIMTDAEEAWWEHD